MECSLHFSGSQVRSVLDFVRNKILDWSLELEKRGIVGENYSFRPDDKQGARVVTNHIYGGNVGVLGSVAGDANNSDFYSNRDHITADSVQQLATKIREVMPALPPEVRVTISGPLADLERQGKAAVPTVSKVSGALHSMRNALEGSAGNLAASGILAALAGVHL